MKAFNLEHAIAAWRRTLEHRDSILDEDVAELERHVRDQVEELMRSGVDPQEAFARALREMGDPAETEHAYREVFYRKVRRKHLVAETASRQLMLLEGYVKAAVRSLSKRKGSAVVNVVGLAVGLAAALLIYQYVDYERGFDAFHEDVERIYRVRQDVFRQDELLFEVATTYPAVGPTLASSSSAVESFTRAYLWYGGGVMRVEETVHNESQVFVVDSTFFSVFSYPLLSGDAETVLSRPNTAVLSEETASKYFGNAEPVGRTFTFANGRTYEVTGVARSPERSHLKFSVLLSFDREVLEPSLTREAWSWYDFYTYVKLRPGVAATQVEASLQQMVEAHKGPDAARNERLSLQPVRDIHLKSNLLQEARTNGSAQTVYFLTLIGGLILLIAWINYVNLSTARASERAREIGVRRVVGAHRSDLVRQFMLESALVNGAGCALAVLISMASLPAFERLTGIDLELSMMLSAPFLLLLGSAWAVGTVGAGIYPAYVLSSYGTSAVLKGRPSRRQGGYGLRRGLVFVQFAAAMALVVGTLVVHQQIDFMKSQDLGFEIDEVLLLDGPDVVTDDSTHDERVATFKEELGRHPSVRAVSGTSEVPGHLIYWTSGARRLQDDPNEAISMHRVGIDDAYFDTFDHKLLAGRGFDRERPADVDRIVVNETAARALQLGGPNDAIGARIRIGRDTLEVVGVVENFHQEGLQKDFYPIAFHYRPDEHRYFAVRLDPSSADHVISQARGLFEQLFPQNPFSSVFLDDRFDAQYRTDRQFGRVFTFFALLAVFVAVLGLSGLSAYTASQRTKEIGIRKVLGSQVSGILALLAGEYARLICYSAVIAVPAAWFALSEWLEGFAFRMELTPWPFLIALVLVLAASLLTVSIQSFRAARTNPAVVLRSE